MEKPKKKTEAGLHDGHKQRLRNKFLYSGNLDNFSEHEILEMLLSYSIVRKDTNAMAHELINKFGSLSGVLEAATEELKTIDGVSDRTATLIKMQYELVRAYTASKFKITKEKYAEDTVIPYLQGKFFGRTEEYVYLICIGAKGNVLCCREIDRGISEVKLDFRRIMMQSYFSATRSAVVAHNHPNGILKPSQEDIEATLALQSELDKYDIKLLDHFIFTDRHWTSIINDHSFTIKTIIQGEDV